MEKIYQFVDDIITSRRDDFCAIADDIWDHPETRFQEFWSAARLADALETEGFQLTRHAGGIPNALSPATARVNRSSPCSASLMRWQDSANRRTVLNQHPRRRGKTATAVGIISSAPRRSPPPSPRNSGCSSKAERAPCAFMAARGKKAARVKPLWCARDYSMILTPPSRGIRKPGPGCSVPARWPIFRRRGALPEPLRTRQTHRIWGGARWTPSR